MKLMIRTRADGLPVAASIAAANVSENRLLESLLDSEGNATLPEVILADGAYDDDPLRDRLAERGIFLLAPHRENRKKPPRHDGRHMRRYKRRYVVERTNSWLQTFRRLVVRHEYYSFHYSAFVALACLIIVGKGL
jgi:transposase